MIPVEPVAREKHVAALILASAPNEHVLRNDVVGWFLYDFDRCVRKVGIEGAIEAAEAVKAAYFARIAELQRKAVAA